MKLIQSDPDCGVFIFVEIKRPPKDCFSVIQLRQRSHRAPIRHTEVDRYSGYLYDLIIT